MLALRLGSGWMELQNIIILMVASYEDLPGLRESLEGAWATRSPAT